MDNWTAQQIAAISRVNTWLGTRSRQVFRMWGFAGTGKTTLLKYLTAHTDTRVVAFTGKAALVLRKKGCTGASTIHSMIYRSIDKHALRLERDQLYAKQKRDGELSEADYKRLQEVLDDLAKPAFALNPEAFVDRETGADNRPELIAIDEASMVDERMGRDLLSFGIPLLIVGDPAQLPPIEGRGYFISGAPDVMLDEIHRQAENSGIIRMATQARQGMKARDCGADARVTNRMPPGWWEDPALQLLCGRNITRRNYNARARAQRGFDNDGLPVEGDKLVCLRNNHSEGLLNGSLWHVLEATYGANGTQYFTLYLRSEDDNDKFVLCQAHKRVFTEPDPYKQWDWQERAFANEFDYGYALTVHKAQGSQWPKVVLVDESWCFREHKHRWLYTGITRAADELTVIR